MDQEVAALRKDLAALTKRVAQNEEIREAKYLTYLMKAMSNNVKITGMKYKVREAQKKDHASQQAFQKICLKALVDNQVIDSDLVIHGGGPHKGKPMRVVRAAHPLHNSDNAAVVVAFLETWIVDLIKVVVVVAAIFLNIARV